MPHITAARMVCIIIKPLVISYVGLYIAAALFAWAVGVENVLEAFQGLFVAHLLTQLPLLLLLASAWIICALADSLAVGTVWGCASDALALPGRADLHGAILRFAKRLRGLASPKRTIIFVEAPAASFLTPCTSPPPCLATGWSPSTHPSLTYG